MSQFDLKNKRILITGASSGIGRQTAIQCSHAGAELLITGRNEKRLNETFNSLSGKGHHFFIANLADENEIRTLTGFSENLDGVVFSAGITAYMPASFINQKHIDQLLKINFESVVLLVSGLLQEKKINPGSSLVMLSSVASTHPYFGGSMYSSSKAALEAYVKTLALELAPKKIRANCLSPSFVKTDMVAGAEKTISSESMGNMEKMHPLGFGEPEDVANAIQFFLSDASKWVTGTKLVMGGV